MKHIVRLWHWFLLPRWKHVQTLSCTSFRYNNESIVIMIYCYESKFGKRKVKISISGKLNGHPQGIKMLKSTQLWVQKVDPWLQGIDVEYIPGYNEIEESKFVKRLSGKETMITRLEEC